VLLPRLADVEVEGVSRADGAVSRRVHSRYERRLLETAVGGCEVVICLSFRRFLCLSPEFAAVTASVRAFAAIMNERRARKLLGPSMTVALATGEPALNSFVTGLRQPRPAPPPHPPRRLTAMKGHGNCARAKIRAPLTARL
jgi:hypothetical protein